ncbi:DUF397 domain-containing protein [Streptomyces sp. NPDC002516]
MKNPGAPLPAFGSRCGSLCTAVPSVSTPGGVLVRDSKHTGGPIVAVSTAIWQAFIRQLPERGDRRRRGESPLSRPQVDGEGVADLFGRRNDRLGAS